MTWRDYKRTTEAALKGRRARVLRRLESRGGNVIHEGALVTIRGKMNGLRIEVDECERCHSSIGMSKVSPTDLELLPAGA